MDLAVGEVVSGVATQGIEDAFAAVGDGGEIEQLLIYVDAEGRADARPSRRINLPSKIKYCVADDATGQVYVSQQAVGVWRFNGDPEADAQGTRVARQHVAGAAGELLALGHQGAGVGVEGAPEHRQPGAAGVALEQLAAKVRLQPADLLAQGRLGDVLARRRLTDRLDLQTLDARVRRKA